MSDLQPNWNLQFKQSCRKGELKEGGICLGSNLGGAGGDPRGKVRSGQVRWVRCFTCYLFIIIVFTVDGSLQLTG